MNLRPKVPSAVFITLSMLCAAGIALAERAKHIQPKPSLKWPHRPSFLR